MASIPNTSYILDSRSKSSGTNSVAQYNMIAAGTVPAGTYELLSFSSVNQLYNVDSSNQNIWWDEGAADLTAVLTAGNYTAATLATEIKVVMDPVSASTFTVVHDAAAGLFTITIAAGTYRFKFATNTTNTASSVMGYSGDGVLAAAQVSDRVINLSLHSKLLVLVNEDGTRNVTTLDGSEFSFYVPLKQGYQDDIDVTKTDIFAQTISLPSSNILNVSLFTEDGVAVPVLNAPDYLLVIRRVF